MNKCTEKSCEAYSDAFDNNCRTCNCHPLWEMEYYDKMGKIIAKY